MAVGAYQWPMQNLGGVVILTHPLTGSKKRTVESTRQMNETKGKERKKKGGEPADTVI